MSAIDDDYWESPDCPRCGAETEHVADTFVLGPLDRAFMCTSPSCPLAKLRPAGPFRVLGIPVPVSVRTFLARRCGWGDASAPAFVFAMEENEWRRPAYVAQMLP